MKDLVICGSPAQAAERVADLFLSELKPGHAVLLSGGSSPEPVYRRFGAAPRSWDGISFFWGDERIVPLTSERSNANGFLSAVGAGSGVHEASLSPVPVEDANPAQAYEALIRRMVPGTPIPRFDFALLGIGADGHTASLFDGVLSPADRLVIPAKSPTGEPRVSVTEALLGACRRLIFLAHGEGKAEALREVIEGGSSAAARIFHASENKVIFTDEAAANLIV